MGTKIRNKYTEVKWSIKLSGSKSPQINRNLKTSLKNTQNVIEENIKANKNIKQVTAVDVIEKGNMSSNTKLILCGHVKNVTQIPLVNIGISGSKLTNYIEYFKAKAKEFCFLSLSR